MQKNSLFRRLLITLTLTGAAICLIFMGTVFAGGVTTVGEIQGHPALKQSYEMGKNV